MHKPYYGITGVTTAEQSKGLLKMIDELGMPQEWQLMIGVLTSWRGLAYGTLADPVRYLLPHELEMPMLEDTRLLNLVHYNSRGDGVFSQLEALLQGAATCDGVQLNIAWPQVASLERWHMRRYGRVVLQVGRRAYAEVGRSPERLATRLLSYAGCISEILLDLSGGEGRPIDIANVCEMLRRLTADGRPPFRLGVAGGLSGANVYEVMRPLLDLYPELSFDAQSGLYGTKGLDMEKCHHYLSEVARLLHS